MKSKLVAIAFVVVFAFLSCSDKRYAGIMEKNERMDITEQTILLELNIEDDNELTLSELIKDVSYLELENNRESFMYPLKNVKMVDSLIYVQDIENQLKCFDLRGNFVRNTYRIGNGPGEIVKLYDFDVDRQFLYLLDGARSALSRYTHDGSYVDSRSLPFRAIRFKRVYNGMYMFELAPYTLENDEESYLIAVTDTSFSIKNKYFTERELKVTRTPYFENSISSVYFAPLFRRGIYKLEHDSLFLKYYLDFKTPYYEPSKDVAGDLEAKNNKIFYTYDNPFHTERFLIQNFATSKDMRGLLLLDLKTGESSFIRKIVNDMDNVYDFDFIHTKYYDVDKDLFIANSNFYYREWHSEEVVGRVEKHLVDSVANILIKNGTEEQNPILMFYRLQHNCLK